MKRFFQYLAVVIGIFSLQVTLAQDKPTGFASAAGYGLETTTGGEGGEVVIADTYDKFKSYAGATSPYIIIVKGTLESTSWKQVTVNSNKTIVGYGTDATLKNMELHIISKSNIIIRNLIIRDSNVESDVNGKSYDYDAIQSDYTNHLWIDHCFFTNCNDGLIDLRHGTDLVTVSYTKLSHHNKTFGIGWISDQDEHDFHVTIHHCWIDSTNQRNPSFDVGIGHLYNNYLHAITSYGNLARGMARVVEQNSYFLNVKNPLHAQDSAYMYVSNNILINCTGNVTGNIDTMMYDPADFYDYTLDPVEQVKDIVTAEAGPQQYVSNQYIEETTGINNLSVSKNANEINYFVDQGSRTLNLQSETVQNLKVKIYSCDGRLVNTFNVNLGYHSGISLNNLNSGVYIVRLELLNKVETGKIFLN